MELISTPRIEFLRGLVAEITQDYGHGRVMVAVDGVDGSGKPEFADGMADVFREAGIDAFRASMEDFHRPRIERYRLGRDSAEGFYLDSYDYRTLRRVLIDPFQMGGSTGFQTSAFDLRRDAAIVSSWQTAGDDAALVIDGNFLNRRRLRGSWNYSVWLDVPWDVAYSRLAESRGADPDPSASSNARYRGGQELYFAGVDPQQLASAVVDNTDPDRPIRMSDINR